MPALGRSTGREVKYSAFCLSLMSPVFRRMICGTYKERADRRVQLDADEERLLRLAMDLSCGREEGAVASDLGEMLRLGAFADR